MMRLNFDKRLLDQMSEGVILLNRQAQVMGHNTAAEAWVQRCKEKCNKLRQVIDQVILGRVELPAKLGLFAQAEAAADDTHPPAAAWLCRDGLNNYAIFLSPHKLPTPNPELVEKRFVSLLGDDVLQHMSTLRALLQDRSGDAEQREQAIATQSDQLDTLLAEITRLATLMQHEQLIDETRVEMDELIKLLLPTLQTKHHNPFAFNSGSNRYGVLFGNVAWLNYALRVLLQALGESAPPGGQIDINMHQMGGFMVLSGNVTRRQAVSVNAVNPEPHSSNAGAHRAAAQMMMCKRIIELHAGKLKLNFMSGIADGQQHPQNIESFTLTMATGISSQQKTASCAECPIALQAQAYAMDMATLLSQQTTSPK